MELSGDALVLSEEIANFASAYADVASRNVHIGTNHLIEFGHERLTEPHDLCVALTTGGEVGTSLAATHGQCGQCVLECLLESEELQNGEVHGRVESQSAFVRADGAVELYAVSDVDLYLAFVVHPRHAEGRDALWFDDSLHDFSFLEFRMLVVHILNRGKHFSHGLQELGLSWMLLLQILHDFLNVHKLDYF